jgi:acyl carrier protein phosphodiesterase
MTPEQIKEIEDRLCAVACLPKWCLCSTIEDLLSEIKQRDARLAELEGSLKYIIECDLDGDEDAASFLRHLARKALGGA